MFFLPNYLHLVEKKNMKDKKERENRRGRNEEIGERQHWCSLQSCYRLTHKAHCFCQTWALRSHRACIQDLTDKRRTSSERRKETRHRNPLKINGTRPSCLTETLCLTQITATSEFHWWQKKKKILKYLNSPIISKTSHIFTSLVEK